MAIKYLHENAEGAALLDPKTPISAREMGQQLGIPFDVLSRVLQQLSGVGILKSEHGVSGGYCISKNLAMVSLFEIMDSVLDEVDIAKCLNSETNCDMASGCTIAGPVKVLNEKVRNFYSSLNILDLITSDNDSLENSKIKMTEGVV
jgi:Rrf2 family nitric oxide-sensitive transcriptional repressor